MYENSKMIENRSIILAKDVVVASATLSEKRTLMSELGLLSETKLCFLKTVQRSEDNCFTNDIYQICDSDYRVIIKHNCGPTEELINFDIVEIEKSCSNDQLFYENISKLAVRFGLPENLCMALGVEENVYLRFMKIMNKKIPENFLKKLDSGDYKSSLYSILGSSLYIDMQIDNLDIEKIRAIASFITCNCA